MRAGARGAADRPQGQRGSGGGRDAGAHAGAHQARGGGSRRPLQLQGPPAGCAPAQHEALTPGPQFLTPTPHPPPEAKLCPLPKKGAKGNVRVVEKVSDKAVWEEEGFNDPFGNYVAEPAVRR